MQFLRKILLEAGNVSNRHIRIRLYNSSIIVVFVCIIVVLKVLILVSVNNNTLHYSKRIIKQCGALAIAHQSQ